MDMYLAKLKEKPTPNVNVKSGLSFSFSSDVKEIFPKDREPWDEEEPEEPEEQEEQEEQEQERKDDVEKDHTHSCIIIDQRTTSNLNRETFMNLLQKRQSVTVEVEKVEKEAEEAINGLVIEDEEQGEQDENETQTRDKKKETTTTKKDVKSNKVVAGPKRVVRSQRDIAQDVAKLTTLVSGTTIQDRVPKRSHYKLHTSSYYMNNRKRFISQLVPLFKKYSDDLQSGKQPTRGDIFEPMIHQQVIRDYLNLYTPYRGLLLFHGLGSGKTCSSIVTAEGMKSQKQIYVMTLASLKANFFNQLKECGDPMYRLDQYWEFISIEGRPDYIPILSNTLSLPLDSIEKRGGAWMVNATKESNFQELSDAEKKALNEQIDEMIRSKYIDVNYNGLNENIMERMTEKGTINPFDNSVVIIDEVHNFVSMIVNKIKEKKSISYRLYEYLMSATNTRIVLLSGTPIINYPNEIGILYNILRGYIKTWTFPVKIMADAEKPTRDNIIKWLEEEGLHVFDYVEFSGESVMITRNPFGFINKNVSSKKNKEATRKLRDERHNKTQKIGGGLEEYRGIQLDESGNLSDVDFKKLIVKALRKHGLETPIPSKIKSTNHIALPDNSKEFLQLFVELDSSEMKNKNVFQKRILGLTSYFKGADDSLYPSYVPSEQDTMYHFERIPMSAYQFQTYEKIREEESKQEKNRRKQMAKQQNAQELFQVSSTYKIASRLACNFAFPDPPGRPKKNSGEMIDSGDKHEFELDVTKGGGNESEDEEDDDSEEVEENSDTEDEDMQEGGKGEKSPQVVDNIVLHDIEIGKDDNESKNTSHENEEENKEEEEKEKEEEEEKGKDFHLRVANVLEELKARKEEIFTKSGLQMYSPKFLRILENIQDPENTGLHLIYSQFRTLEGVSLLTYVLEANGYAPFRIQKIAGSWELDEKEEEKGKPKYALHTGTESDEEKKIILNVYNSNWAEVPSSIVRALEDKEHNHYGDCIKVLMITASGAEGINLKSTRFVHIVEPYWNMVRLEQVIGRARRIASHSALPEELRTVKVYLYMSVIPEEVLTSDKHKSLRSRDISRLSNKLANTLPDTSFLGRYVRHLSPMPQVISTDQLLFERALQKDQVNSQILTAVKESAIDCSLYENKGENLACYSFGQVRSNAFGSYPTIAQDVAEKDVQEVSEKKMSFREYMYDGVKYAQNKANYELYNFADYLKAKNEGAPMHPIGKVIQKEGKENVVLY